MGILGIKFGKKARDTAVNDALIKMEKMAAQMATAAGNTVTTDICEKRIQQLRTEK